MRCNVGALAGAIGIVWGVAILFVAALNVAAPGYGRAFLEAIASVYWGFHPGSIGGAVVGGIYGLADGAIAGALVAWLYNVFARPSGA